jgi:diguanylate cyclase (GGDEF)-like protein
MGGNPEVERAIEVLLRELGATRARRALAERAGLRFERRLALNDELTGLANRSLLYEQLVRGLAKRRRHGTALAVLLLDVDGLDRVNDAHGRDAGDEVLLAIAGRLDDVVRPTDTVSRFSDDEFVVVLEDLEDEVQAVRIAERLSTRLAAPVVVGEAQIAARVSGGLALASLGSDPDELVGRADAALARAKDAGGGRVELFDADLRERADRRADVEQRLRLAVERGELDIVYQPRVDVRTQRLDGFEALVRWEGAEDASDGGVDLASVAEQTGLMVPIGHWALLEAARQARLWEQAGHPLTVAIGVSPRQLAEGDVPGAVRDALERTGASPTTLALQIAGAAAEDALAVANALRELRATGVRIALGGLGGRHATLEHLRRLGVHEVGIDPALVGALPSSGEDDALVRAIVGMAAALRVIVIADGVSTEEQLDALREAGVDLVQGPVFGAPLEASAVDALLGE